MPLLPFKNNKSEKKRSLLFFFSILFLSMSLLHFPIAQALEEEPLNYIALGDSLTAGLGASEQQYLRLGAFVPLLTTELRKENPIHVENHGIPGMTSEELLLYLEQGPGVKAKLESAHLITITIGGNDLLQLLNQSSEEPKPQEIKKTLEAFGETISKIIDTIRFSNAKAPIYIMDLYTPYDQQHPWHTLGKQAISMYNSALSSKLRNYKHVTLVSVYDAFMDKGSTHTHINEGDIHPNDAGYQLIFNAFKEAIWSNK